MSQLAEEQQISFFLIHGFALWSAWTIFGLFQVTTARYLKHHWQMNRWLHAISGSIVLSSTLGYGIYGLIKIGKIKDDIHGPMGIVATALTLLLAITGLRTWATLD